MTVAELREKHIKNALYQDQTFSCWCIVIAGIRDSPDPVCRLRALIDQWRAAPYTSFRLMTTAELALKELTDG